MRKETYEYEDIAQKWLLCYKQRWVWAYISHHVAMDGDFSHTVSLKLRNGIFFFQKIVCILQFALFLSLIKNIYDIFFTYVHFSWLEQFCLYFDIINKTYRENNGKPTPWNVYLVKKERRRSKKMLMPQNRNARISNV